jgi:hypothetical protein
MSILISFHNNKKHKITSLCLSSWATMFNVLAVLLSVLSWVLPWHVCSWPMNVKVLPPAPHGWCAPATMAAGWQTLLTGRPCRPRSGASVATTSACVESPNWSAVAFGTHTSCFWGMIMFQVCTQSSLIVSLLLWYWWADWFNLLLKWSIGFSFLLGLNQCIHGQKFDHSSCRNPW